MHIYFVISVRKNERNALLSAIGGAGKLRGM